jgi:hypothetical protein
MARWPTAERGGITTVNPARCFALLPLRRPRTRDRHQAAIITSAPERDRGCTGLLAALAELCLLDPQVAQQPVERLLVGIVLLPAGEVADVVG